MSDFFSSPEESCYVVLVECPVRQTFHVVLGMRMRQVWDRDDIDRRKPTVASSFLSVVRTSARGLPTVSHGATDVFQGAGGGVGGRRGSRAGYSCQILVVVHPYNSPSLYSPKVSVQVSCVVRCVSFAAVIAARPRVAGVPAAASQVCDPENQSERERQRQTTSCTKS